MPAALRSSSSKKALYIPMQPSGIKGGGGNTKAKGRGKVKGVISIETQHTRVHASAHWPPRCTVKHAQDRLSAQNVVGELPLDCCGGRGDEGQLQRIPSATIICANSNLLCAAFTRVRPVKTLTCTPMLVSSAGIALTSRSRTCEVSCSTCPSYTGEGRR